MTHDDDLLPLEPAVRGIARDLYDRTAALPIISPHGHVDARILLENLPFADPARLFLAEDHYITRLLVAAGVDVHGLLATNPRRAWQALLDHWHLFAGTASGYWLSRQLISLFGADPEEGGSSFDAIASALAGPAFLPRTVFGDFNVEVLATTDDPMASLDVHAALRADSSWSTRMLPTFRPDALIDPRNPRFGAAVEELAAWTGSPVDDYAGYLDGLEGRRAHFIRHGAGSADHGVLEPFTIDIDEAEAAGLYRAAVHGSASEAELRVFAGHMLLQMARMSVDDGLVMTLHAGVRRNHTAAAFERFGPDAGHDIPVATEFTENLRPLLNRFGLRPDFHLILFTVDESTYSREIAPLAGFYPSVYVGAPWWFLDAPEAARRFRSATTETSGFYRGSGFVDDTRALLSIPARHDMARRVDAAFLARMVSDGRMSMPMAERIAVDLVTTIPRKAFKL